MDRLPTTRLNTLMNGYLAGSLTQEESDEFAGYVANPAYAGNLRKMLGDSFLQDEGTAMEYRRRNRVMRQITGKTADRPSLILRLLPYAAAAAIILAVGLFFWEQGQRSTGQGLAATEILPGGNRATLTLADGQTLELSEAQKGIIIGDGITYLDGSTVTPEDSPSGPENGNLRTIDYVLSTPKGGTYQVTLPDGSKVWLNAGSTLKYPSRFSGGERIVELEGEAYFSVKSMTHAPFRVMSQGQRVEVLGTQFNVSAYPDEPTTKTTLVEGSVEILNLKSKILNQLSPGDQSITREAHTDIAKVDTEPYVAWKDGIFIFNDTPLAEVMRQIARWYDVEVDYRNLPDKHINGIISRDVKLSSVLRSLAVTGNIHFTLNERRLTLMDE